MCFTCFRTSPTAGCARIHRSVGMPSVRWTGATLCSLHGTAQFVLTHVLLPNAMEGSGYVNSRQRSQLTRLGCLVLSDNAKRFRPRPIRWAVWDMNGDHSAVGIEMSFPRPLFQKRHTWRPPRPRVPATRAEFGPALANLILEEEPTSWT